MQKLKEIPLTKKQLTMIKFYRNHPNYKKDYRREHPEVVEKEKASNRKWQELHKRKLKDFVSSYKAKPCMDCGIQYPSYVMDFDHKDPLTKVASLSTMIRHGFKEERLLEEIQKCDVVCANCHRERTHKQHSIGLI